MGKKGSLNITKPPAKSTGGGSGNGGGSANLALKSRAEVRAKPLPMQIDDGERMEEPVSAFRSILPQILAVNVKNVLLFGYGMTLGFPTILIPAILGGEGRESTMDNKLHLSKEEISWLSSINLICVPLGCIFSGSLAQPLGRRRAMQFVNIPILAAWLCFYFSTDVTHLYAGLCLAGLSGGLSEAPVLTYVAEVTTPRVRGLLAASGSFCAILGVFVQFILGTFLKWRLIALISVVVPVISFSLLFFVPESPHWLIQKGRLEEAQKSLAWLRGWVSVDAVRAEYEIIYANVTKSFGDRDTSCSGKLRPYRQRSFLWPYVIITTCFFIGHFSGMTTLQTYAVQIFHTLKAPIDKYYATMLLGLAELIGTFLCILLVHTTGKRRIVLASTIGCGLCFLGTATYAYFLNEIPGQSISNVVANSSDILSQPLHDVVSFNGTGAWEEPEFEDDIPTTTTDYPFELSLFQNDSVEFTGAESMMDFQVAVVNEEENEDNTQSVDDDEVTTLSPQPSVINANNNSNKNTTAAEEPVQANLPETILLPVTKRAENKFAWVPLTLLLGSATLSHCGIRLIPWMLIGEIYPTAVRGGASGLSGGTGYIFGFLSNKMFLKLLATLTLPGTFWMYSCVSLCGAVVLYFILPETEGRSLVDIEEHFTGGRTLKESRADEKALMAEKNMLGNCNGDEGMRRRVRAREGTGVGGTLPVVAVEEDDDGLKGNFRRSSCKVSNAGNRQICSEGGANQELTRGSGRRSISSKSSGGSGVVIVVPDKRSPSPIGNTLLPITNPLEEVQNVNPRIYVEFCGSNQTIDDEMVVEVADEQQQKHEQQQQQQQEKGALATTKFNGSERQRTNSQNNKLFEEAVQQHEGAEWLRRIKDASTTMQMDRGGAGINCALGMKRKRIV